MLALHYLLLCAIFLKQDSSELDHNLRVLRKQLISLSQVINTLANIDFASDDAPSESELDLTNDLLLQARVLSCQLQGMTVLNHSLAVLTCLILAFTTEQMQHILVFLGNFAFDLLHNALCIAYLI